MTRPVIMGILNVTPDSFSDGGRWTQIDAAVAHAEQLIADGADLIDIGGESTRPGAARVSPEDEQRRVIPVVRELTARGIRTSIDTMNASTALESLRAGAEIINDVSGGLADPEMFRVIAETNARYVAMHWRGHADVMQAQAQYGDVVREVHDELRVRLDAAIAAGIDPSKIIVDPGLGFSKTADHNWRLLARMPALAELGFPILIGASRKGFLSEFAPTGTSAVERDTATAVLGVLVAQAGAWGVRVHDVVSTALALGILDRWDGARA